MPDEIVNISIQADIAKLRAELAKMPGVGDKEAAKLVTNLTKQYKKAEVAAKKSADATKQAFSSNLQKISGSAAGAAAALGGTFGQIGAAAQGVLKPLAEVGLTMGPAGAIGIGAAAAVVAMGLVATASVAMANSAVEARGRLADLGVVIGGEAATDLDAYSAATRDLSIAMDHLRVAVGSEIAGELAIFARTAADGITAVASLKDEIVTVADVIGGTLAPKTSILIDGLQSAYTWFTQDARAAAELEGKLTSLESKFVDFGPSIDLVTTANERYIESQRQAADASRVAADAARDVDAALGEHKDSAEALAAIVAETNSDLLSAEGQIQKAYADRVKAIRELGAATEDWAGMSAALADAEAGRDRELAASAATQAERSAAFDKMLADTAVAAEEAGVSIQGIIDDAAAERQKERIEMIRDAALDAAVQIGDALGDVFGMLSERAMESASELRDHNKNIRAEQKKISNDILQLSKEASKEDDASRKKNLEGMIEALEAEKEGNRQRLEDNQALMQAKAAGARRAWMAQKIAAITGIGIQTGLGIANAFGTVPWPAAPIVAAGVAVQGGLLAAGVAAQPMPQFPMGLSNDHMMVGIQPDKERVLTSRGKKDDDEIRHFNEGRGKQDYGGDTIIQISGRDVMRSSKQGKRVRCDPRSGKSSRRR